jgi:hypothetical protein
MQIGIIEMPAEDAWRVQLDGELINGYFKLNPHNQRYTISVRRDGHLSKLRTEPHSREGASCLLLFQHFENERRMLKANADS